MSLEEMELVLLCAGRRGRLRSQDDGVFDYFSFFRLGDSGRSCRNDRKPSPIDYNCCCVETVTSSQSFVNLAEHR